ncbi:hypothetical protein AOLI_G00326400 [Acnodon oligacanthus]
MEPLLFSSGAEPSDPHRQQDEALCLQEITTHLQQDFDQPADSLPDSIVKRHKTSMKNKYGSLFEGIRT